MRILITGGAGFIGSHLADELLRRGHTVRILDNLSPQVHGAERRRPDYLAREAELRVGDVRDAEAVRAALEGADAVYHLAAAVGVGQSMYQVADYTGANSLGTAVLLEALLRRPAARLIVTSSMSVYGEGLYRDANGRPVQHAERTASQLREGDFEPRGADREPLSPLPTPEGKPPSLSSIYALTKYDQERMCLILGRAYNIPTFALRLFNVYGPRQALSNPYTGVLAIFAARYLNGNPPLIYEDGRQRRDFVHVRDVVRAGLLALEADEAAAGTYNIGSGRPVTIAELAGRLRAFLGGPPPQILGTCRAGDIRHCFADITRARRVLGYAPEVTLEQGLSELCGWLAGQRALDQTEQAQQELQQRGLMIEAGAG
jgi:dTDP-L-rhamnose 4-epimerase